MCDPIEPPDEQVSEYAEWIECSFAERSYYDFFDNLMGEVLEINIVHSLDGEFRGYELTLCEGKYKPYMYLSQRSWESRAHIISYYCGNREAISFNEEVSSAILEYVRKFDSR